jgi:hypothetical protein
MVERFIAPVLKTGDPQGSVGSNPTPSANSTPGALVYPIAVGTLILDRRHPAA